MKYIKITLKKIISKNQKEFKLMIFLKILKKAYVKKDIYKFYILMNLTNYLRNQFIKHK
jgi:hypothetical protein